MANIGFIASLSYYCVRWFEGTLICYYYLTWFIVQYQSQSMHQFDGDVITLCVPIGDSLFSFKLSIVSLNFSTLYTVCCHNILYPLFVWDFSGLDMLCLLRYFISLCLASCHSTLPFSLSNIRATVYHKYMCLVFMFLDNGLHLYMVWSIHVLSPEWWSHRNLSLSEPNDRRGCFIHANSSYFTHSLTSISLCMCAFVLSSFLDVPTWSH